MSDRTCDGAGPLRELEKIKLLGRMLDQQEYRAPRALATKSEPEIESKLKSEDTAPLETAAAANLQEAVASMNESADSAVAVATAN
jgi:hypothetical protein